MTKSSETGSHRAELAFGCAAIAGIYGATEEAAGRATLDAAWAAGLRRFDTAPFYGLGVSERRVGAFLADKPRAEYALTTKVGRLIEDGAVRFDYSAEGIRASLAASRERLGVDRFDCIYVHDIGTYAHGAENARHLAALRDSGLPLLRELRAAGEIGGIGLGVNEVGVCLELMQDATFDEILLAGRYTLLDRTAEAEFLPACVDAGTRVVVGGVFNSGILATGPGPNAHFDYDTPSAEITGKVERIEAVVTRHGLSLAEAALNFPAGHPAVSHVLIGTGKVSSLERNLAQWGRALPAEMLAEIAPLTITDGP